VRAKIRQLHSRLARLEARAPSSSRPWPPEGGAVSDEGPMRFDWYARSCPCGRLAGECPEHPRAREGQRPPASDWRIWLLLMGRAAGKTRAAAEWVRHRVESGASRRLALVGATAADVRDVMIEGPSGLLAISPPWSRPRYEPSKRRLAWPNGAVATTYSAEEPERLRGPEHDAAWCDELAAWRYPEAFEHLLLGLRVGPDPRLCATTTPKRVPLVLRLLEDLTTAISRGTTYDNWAHLAEAFFRRFVASLEGTPLGQRELLGELPEVGRGAWFARFDPVRHVASEAEYDPAFPVHLAIDCGVSRHTAAVWFQVHPSCRSSSQLSVASCQSKTSLAGNWELTTGNWELATDNSRVIVFGDWHGEGLYPEASAGAILARSRELPSAGRVDAVRLDPAGSARTGIGPAASVAFERAFGPSVVAQWPRHRVVDGLDRLEVLLDQGRLTIHPRCAPLTAAFRNYTRRRTSQGDWLDQPADPQHPHEDLIDALRGGLCDHFPEG
jgi:hypothetical protein